MNRRDFLKTSLLAGAGMMLARPAFGASNAEAKSNNLTHSKWEKRRLGTMEVSAMGLGCVDMCPVGYYGCKNTKSDIVKLVRHAFDSGITLFDTAEIYGMTVSEEWVGEALAPVRNPLKIETKFGFAVAEGTCELNSKLSLLEAAALVLKRSRTPLNTKEILAKVIESGLWMPNGGKTPEQSLYSAIFREINSKENPRFRKSTEKKGSFEYNR